MKTDRMTLLIAPADKAAIAARAASLNMSVSELVRRAALDYDPHEVAELAELEAILPDFLAAVDSIGATLDRMLERSDAHAREMAHLQSPEYREQIRREIAADPTIDWSRLHALFGTHALAQ
jgi:hypothetical protein